MFVELPCDEPSPLRRLEEVRLAMTKRKEAGEPRGAEQALDAVSFVPHPVQHAVSHAVASARAYNLTVSNIPGPRQPLWMAGLPARGGLSRWCRSPTATPSRSASRPSPSRASSASTRTGRRCPDADALAGAVERSLDELLASAERPVPALVT